MFKMKGFKPGEIFESVKKTICKVGKKNLAIVFAVLLIGGAVYLNWALFRNTDEPGYTYSGGDEAGGEVNIDGQASYAGTDDQNSEGSYFALTQINRTRARDESMEVLQQIVDNDESLEAAKQEALSGINEIAASIEQEANIETLVKAKGFEECVAVISGDKCSIVVSSDGLMANEVAQIQEIVYEQTNIEPSGVKIIERAAH